MSRREEQPQQQQQQQQEGEREGVHFVSAKSALLLCWTSLPSWPSSLHHLLQLLLVFLLHALSPLQLRSHLLAISA